MGSEISAPSQHFLSNLEALHEAARLGPVVDLACGRGRHALPCAEARLPTVGLDRNPGFLHELQERARASALRLSLVRADLETSHGIPLKQGSCGAILVYRFLYRPLAPAIAACLRPGGLLLYETFTRAQAELPTGPSNPDFLLAPRELPTLFPGLEVEDYEEAQSGGPRPEARASLVARRPLAA